MPVRMNRKPISVTLFLLLVLVALSECPLARAQALPVATRKADLTVFGGFDHSNPDFGAERNNGLVAGVDYTRYFGWRIAPSFEIRANRTTGFEMDQETALAGLRFKADIHRRFHPYANFLVGGTKITFHFPLNPNYLTDTATAYSAGGGLDVDVYRSFQVKVDYQQQFENFGPNGTQPNNADFTLAPTHFSIGVVYRIPFGAHKK
jgi:opacity protein-like surface antigen